MKEKKDLRIIKTKMALYNALTNLMKDKTFEEIRVSDICNEALINRSTFYAHYDDKYELLVDFLKNVENELTSELSKNNNIVNTKEYYIELIRLFLNHIEEKKDIYNSIMINNRNSIMMDILLNVVNNDLLNKANGNNNSVIPSDIAAKFYLGGVINLGIDYISNNKYSKEDLIKYYSILIPDNIGKE